MATVSFQPPGRGAEWTASSKSFASAPSMVTRGRSRRSVRPRAAASAGTSSGSRSASASTSSGQTWGIPWDRIATSAAMPGRSGSPRRSTMRPLKRLPQRSSAGGSTSSTTTTLPVGAPPVRDRHVVGKVPVVGSHEGVAPHAMEAADHHPAVPLEHLDHHPSLPGSQPAAPGRDPDLAGDPVSVHQAPHLARGQEHVLAPIVAGEKPVAVAMGDHPAPYHFRGVHDPPSRRPPRSRPRVAGGPHRPSRLPAERRHRSPPCAPPAPS